MNFCQVSVFHGRYPLKIVSRTPSLKKEATLIEGGNGKIILTNAIDRFT